MNYILLTGGAGYIGSHCAIDLLKDGYNLIILDNFSNSRKENIDKILEITGTKSERVVTVEGDIRNRSDIEKAFLAAGKRKGEIKAVIHFAGAKIISESVSKPLKYYDINVGGTLNLLTTMQIYKCKAIMFSSSASVYGIQNKIPINETAKTNPLNPYANSKAMVENILRELWQSDNTWKISILRYFNPVGCDESGKLGEDPEQLPNNLFPVICDVLKGRKEKLVVYGKDWPTKDGTGIRDYIHVKDLAEGHTAALRTMLDSESGLITLNLGSGKGYSVLEIISSFEEASGQVVKYGYSKRRDGDSAISVADPTLAEKVIRWKTKKTLQESCRDAWNYHTNR